MELMKFKFPAFGELREEVYDFQSDTVLRRHDGWVHVHRWEGLVPYIMYNGIEIAGVRVLDKPDTVCAKAESAWSTQVGGEHYTGMRIQPFQFSMANGLDPMQHTIVKYVARFRTKNGLQDLEKAKHTLELLIQYEKDNAKKS